jgi:hypothetical protein
LDLFRVSSVSLDQIQSLAEDLLTTRNHSSLLKLCLTYAADIAWPFDRMIRQMVDAKDWGSAELLVKTFEPDPDQKGTFY